MFNLRVPSLHAGRAPTTVELVLAEVFVIEAVKEGWSITMVRHRSLGCPMLLALRDVMGMEYE